MPHAANNTPPSPRLQWACSWKSFTPTPTIAPTVSGLIFQLFDRVEQVRGTSRPSPRTKRTRLVPPPVLSGHATCSVRDPPRSVSCLTAEERSGQGQGEGWDACLGPLVTEPALDLLEAACEPTRGLAHLRPKRSDLRDSTLAHATCRCTPASPPTFLPTTHPTVLSLLLLGAARCPRPAPARAIRCAAPNAPRTDPPKRLRARARGVSD